MKRFILLIFIASLTFVSCSQYEDIIVEDVTVNNFKFESTSKVILDLSVKIDNGSNKTLAVKKIDFTLATAKGRNFADVTLVKASKVKPHSDDYYPVQLQVNITDLMAIMSSGLDMHSPDLSKIFATGKLKMKAGCLPYTMKVDKKSLKDLVNSL